MKHNLQHAEEYCARHGHRLTAPRRAVLEIITRSPKPIGAYDIIAAMPDGTKPPTVYRALEFWEAEAFVHRIGSLGLYTGCHAEHGHNGAQFMVCDDCGNATEVHLCDLPAPLQKLIEKNDFKLARWNLELHGTCSNCTA